MKVKESLAMGRGDDKKNRKGRKSVQRKIRGDRLKQKEKLLKIKI